MSTPDLAAALEYLRMVALAFDLAHPEHGGAEAAVARIERALADGAEGEGLHEELYAAAVAENERIRAGWNAAEQALAGREAAIRNLCATLEEVARLARHHGVGIGYLVTAGLDKALAEGRALLPTEAPRGE